MGEEEKERKEERESWKKEMIPSTSQKKLWCCISETPVLGRGIEAERCGL